MEKSNFLSSSTKEWFKHVNKIIGNKNNNINLSNIPDLADKPILEQVRLVNAHFANICKKYPPLNKNIIIEECENERMICEITELATYKMLVKFSKKSLGPEDLPQKILCEFAPELATPFCDIINSSIKSGVFPEAYKKAEIIPIPKVNPPRSLSDLRPISKTPIGGKIIEKVMISELEFDVRGKLDFYQ